MIARPRRRRMSFRARIFLLIAAVHFTLIGLSILAAPAMYSGATFIPMVESTGLTIWGIGYLVTGILCTVAVISRWPSFARAGLVFAFSVLMTSAFAVGWGVVATWLDNEPGASSPMIPLTLAALAAKDLVMVRQPLRTPAEDYAVAAARLRAES